jgi:hypothetical protein
MTSATTVNLGKLRPEVKEKWVAALRSGEYQQTKSYLHLVEEDGVDRFCCLGVLCDLAAQEGVVEEGRQSIEAFRDGRQATILYGDYSSYPPDEVEEWAYGVPPDDDWGPWRVTADVFVDPESVSVELVTLNDNRNLTFAEIADRIEAAL